MRKYTWLVALVILALLVSCSLAIAQETKPDAAKPEKSEKKIVIEMPAEGMGQMMPGCQMMGQMPSGMMMGQMGSMAGCGVGQMACGMAQAGCCGMASGGMGCCGAAMGGKGGMGCCMMGQAGGMGKHGCAECYLQCASVVKLTERQKAELKALISAAKKAAIQKQADLKIAQAELNEILSEETLDFVKAKAKIAAISDLKASVQIDRLNNIQKAQKVLTTEQLKEWNAKCKGMAMGMGAGACCAMAKPQMKQAIKIIKDTGEVETEGSEGEGTEEESGN